MQDTDSTYVEGHAVQPGRSSLFGRFLFVFFTLLVLLLLALLPPLIRVNRLQHRVAASISESLGRPVHLDSVSINLLPLPGFTLENLVVDEDPAFGTEPVIRSNSVRVTLRISSLWTRHVEFSTISFSDQTSVNLVHLSNGKWNIESILLQAARIQAAPTAQAKPGPAPRFPYIEATGARLNLKLDHEKTPFSLTDADFALWLPSPQEWHVRIQARPARTDTNVSDTGVIQLEGTLGHATSLDQVPINLQAQWRDAPLGEATLLLLGRDAGLRGNVALSATVQGTVGESAIQTRLQLSNARRADFVPEHPLAVELECLGKATGEFHTFTNVRCSWPPTGSSPTLTLAISGDLPDIRQPNAATIDIGTPGIPSTTLLEWLRVASARVPTDISTAGTLTGSFSHHPDDSRSTPFVPWTGQILITGASLIDPHAGPTSLVVGDVAIHSPNTAPEAHTAKRHATPPATVITFLLAPTQLALGGKEPAILDGRFDTTGYTLHLTGMTTASRLLALAAAIPQFGDNMAAIVPTNRATGPFRIDLTATRPWGGTQLWTDNLTPATHPRHPIHH